MFKVNKSSWLIRSLFLFALCLILSLAVEKPVKSEDLQNDNPPVTNELPPPPIQAPIQETLPIVESTITEVAATSPQPGPLQGFSLYIPTINLNIPLGKTQLDSNRNLMVPADASKAAWYQAGPYPGNNGTALITGHYDSPAGPGVFFQLRKLKPKDEIKIHRSDGSVAAYNIDKLDVYRQDETFPWKQVYSTTGPSSIRIITCHGDYNPKTGRYSHNLVVYASLTTIEEN
jgi:sortase (surface protein transpeptidase)